jgi:type I restriction enzyme S subunit
MIRTSNVKGGRISLDSVKYVTLETYQRWTRRQVPQRGDIVLTREAPLGEVGLIRNEGHVFLGQRLVAYRVNKAVADPTFVFYALQGADLQAQIAAFGSGSTVEHMRVPDAKMLLVNAPPLNIQRRIAGILSAYDDLIEVNTRRISVLEKMVQRLFDELLANFSEQEDQSWRRMTVGDVISVLESGSRPRGGVGTDGDVPSIGAENVLGLGRYDYSKDKFISREYFETMRRGHVRPGDVMLYKDGAYIGRLSMAWGSFPHSQCVVNEHVFLIRPKPIVSSQYLYFWLAQAEMQSKIRGLNANAAQPGLNQPSIKGLPISLPPIHLLKQFDKAAKPILDLLFNLAIQNTGLCKARDLLLPKLIAGEIDLEKAAGNAEKAARRVAAA